MRISDGERSFFVNSEEIRNLIINISALNNLKLETIRDFLEETLTSRKTEKALLIVTAHEYDTLSFLNKKLSHGV
jgi:hypothetical protein